MTSNSIYIIGLLAGVFIGNIISFTEGLIAVLFVGIWMLFFDF